MNEKHLYTLLNVIKNNSNVKILIREGLTFPRIGELTEELIREGLLIYSNQKVTLSASGLEKFTELQVKFKKTNKEEWIEKDLKSIIPKLDKNIIFIPKQNELTF